MIINYAKLNENDEDVQTLAKAVGEKPSTICSMLNNQRYRREYNRQRNLSIKTLNLKVKELEAKLNNAK